MIKNCNNFNLSGAKIDPKFYVLYSIWKELTYWRTMDSYQYRIMNSISILCELNETIDSYLNGFSPSIHNIKECKAEAAIIISKDAVIKKHYSQLYGVLLHHLHNKTETNAELKALHHQIDYCIKNLSADYLQYLIDDLEEDVDQCNYPGIITKANMVVSHCAWQGWSTQALFNLIDMLKGTLSEPIKWDRFKERVSATNKEEYAVFVPINLNYNSSGTDRTILMTNTHKEIQEMGISVLNKIEICEKYNLRNNLLSDKRMYMSVNMMAFDKYSACYSTIVNCASVLNVLSFYNYTEAWNVRNTFFIVYNTAEGTTSKISGSQLFFTYEYLDSTQKIYRASKQIFKTSESDVAKRLNAAYAYSNLSKDSNSEEEKFMNQWVALESLCRSNAYDNIISNVLETVPPALCKRYIYRHFRNFFEDCMRCEIDFKFTTKSIVIAYRDRQEIVKELMEVMRDSTTYSELLDKCRVNDLLKMRCEDLRKLLTDDKQLFGKVKTHYITVKHQLSRLYRIRNGIAHSAKISDSSLRLYIEHLTDYLSCFVSEVVMCSIEKQENDADTIFEMIKDNYLAFCESSKPNNKSASFFLQDFLSTGIINLI